jgi:peptide/nickel transport system ATP-binding protein
MTGKDAMPADVVSQPILAVEDLVKRFKIGSGFFGRDRAFVSAVDGCSFTLAPNEVLGLVGESGSGKSTLARLLTRIIWPDRGRIFLENAEVASRSTTSRRNLSRRIQMVFQDSYASLNPRHTATEEVAFGLAARGHARVEARRRAHDALHMVGLAPALFAGRYPHELSGGQRQRVNIARAIAMSPKVLILDEAVSALDKSVQAQVLNLLIDLRRSLGLSYIFISHDLEVVRYVSDRVVVMYLGKIMEIGPVESVYGAPAHPYTKALIASRLRMDPGQRTSAPPISGDPPSPINPPPGCRFSTRCPIAEQVCRMREPALAAAGESEHLASCHAITMGSGHSLAPALARPATVADRGFAC